MGNTTRSNASRLCFSALLLGSKCTQKTSKQQANTITLKTRAPGIEPTQPRNEVRTRNRYTGTCNATYIYIYICIIYIYIYIIIIIMIMIFIINNIISSNVIIIILIIITTICHCMPAPSQRTRGNKSRIISSSARLGLRLLLHARKP